LLGGAGLLSASIGIVLAILLLIVWGAGMAHMIKTGKFSKAFAFAEIFSIIRGIGWIKYLSWIVLVVVISVVVGALGSIPFVGWLISAIVSPALSVFIFRSMGILYNDGAPPELRSQVATATSGGLVCKSCGATLQPSHKFCPSCGAAAPAPPIEPAASPGGETKFCVSCGAKIPVSAQFCGSCGAKQN
jgi:ribosomal protein L40E